jgi:hypothetical protein
MASFSHFSYIASQKLFMITDLQGSGCLLSDPAIHSEDKNLFKEGTNLKMKGITTFFASADNHPMCNQICTSLGLEKYRLDERETLIFVDDEMKFEDDDDIHIVCELC